MRLPRIISWSFDYRSFAEESDFYKKRVVIVESRVNVIPVIHVKLYVDVYNG
jgi:hypothetical protein